MSAWGISCYASSADPGNLTTDVRIPGFALLIVAHLEATIVQLVGTPVAMRNSHHNRTHMVGKKGTTCIQMAPFLPNHKKAGLMRVPVSNRTPVHMKMTLEIAGSLLKEAKEVARNEGTTVRALVERGLRVALSERRGNKPSFKLPDASVGGKGLHPDAVGRSWDQLRVRSYGGRGD